jgi:hypothetical protein
MSDTPEHKDGRKTQAGVAGVSGGTILTAFVQLLDEGNGWKKPLLLAVPLISAGISVCWYFCIEQLNVWWSDYNYERRVKRLHELTEKQLAKNIPQDEKERVLKKVQDFEISEIDNIITEAKALQISQKTRVHVHTDEKMA